MMKIHLQPPKPATPFILAMPNAWNGVRVMLRLKHEVSYEYSTECTGEGGSGEEKSDTIMLFVSFVPHAQIKHDSREETTFRDAEEEADAEESWEVLGDTHQGTDDTPYEGESWKPESWGGDFEDDVTRDLEQDVANEVDGQRGEVLISTFFETAVRDDCWP